MPYDRSGMEPPEIVKTYVETFAPDHLDAWVKTFGSDATYSDPGTSGFLPRQALKEYLAGLFGGFPDATVETVSLDAISEHLSVWR